MADLFEPGALENLERLERTFPIRSWRAQQHNEVTPSTMSREQVAEALAKEEGRKVSRERIRQIEQKALKKLRRWCARNGFRVEDFLDGYG